MIVAHMLRLFGPAMARARAMLYAGLAVLMAACTDPQAPDLQAPESEPQIELVADVSNELEPPAAPAGSVPAAVGLFMSVRQISRAQAVDRAHQLIQDTNEILEQCDLHLAMEVAQVIDLPAHLHTVQGNEVGSWGGHRPIALRARNRLEVSGGPPAGAS